jgi:hypothetical protein
MAPQASSEPGLIVGEQNCEGENKTGGNNYFWPCLLQGVGRNSKKMNRIRLADNALLNLTERNTFQKNTV